MSYFCLLFSWVIKVLPGFLTRVLFWRDYINWFIYVLTSVCFLVSTYYYFFGVILNLEVIWLLLRLYGVYKAFFLRCVLESKTRNYLMYFVFSSLFVLFLIVLTLWAVSRVKIIIFLRNFAEIFKINRLDLFGRLLSVGRFALETAV